MSENNELKTILTVDNTAFIAKMKESAASAQAFAAKTSSSIEKAGKVLKAGLAIGGVGAGVSFFRSALDEIDKFTAEASRLKIDTNAFQLLEFAAKRTDTSLETISGAIDKLKSKLAKSVGGDAVSVSLAKLGLSLQQLKQLSPDEAFLKITSALQKIPDEYTRVALGTELFTKQFKNLSNFIQGDMNDITASFKQLGGAVDLSGYNKADKAIDELETSLKQFRREMAITFGAPAASLLGSFTGAIRTLKTVVGEGLGPKTGVQGGGLLMNGTDLFKGLSMTDDQINMLAKFRIGQRANANLASPIGGQGGLDAAANSLKIFKSATDIAAGALNKIKDINIKSLLGIEPTSGKDYLSSILNPTEQIKNDKFTALATQLRDNITSGTKGFGLSNESILATMKEIAQNTQVGSGQSKSGMLAAVLELEKQLGNKSNPLDPSNRTNAATSAAVAATTAAQQQTVNVKITVDKDNLIKAVVETPTFTNESIRTMNKVAEDAARAGG